METVILMVGGLFIITDMEEARRSEDFACIANDVFADAIVFFGRYHAAVMFQPAVVRRREIQFWNRLNSKRFQTADFLLHLIRRPTAFDGEFGMAWIDKRLADVDDQHVHFLFNHAIDSASPKVFLATQNDIWLAVGQLLIVHVFGHVITPHVVSKMKQHSLDFSVFDFTHLCFLLRL